MNPEDRVIAANDAFYQAFQDLDLLAMDAVWGGGPGNVCVHPGWDVIRGWADIRESWRAIFAGTGFLQLKVTEVDVVMYRDVAWITCLENIYSVVSDSTAHSVVAATNIFERQGDTWRMVLHHGSPVSHTLGRMEDGEAIPN